MATILIVDERPLDRSLTTVLRTRGHEIVEVSDGHEAFDALARITPDVIISDVLMPTADGCQFVRHMRRERPALAGIPVIFCTAMYHEREARALAHQCGAFDVVTSPGVPHVFLATVDAALGSTARPPAGPPDRADADRHALHPVSSTLAAGIDRSEAEQERLKAVMEVAEQIAAQRDPPALLHTVCHEARRVTLAQHAVLGLLTEEGSPRESLYTSGVDAATMAGVTPSGGGALLTTVVEERRSLRVRNPGGQPEAIGFPADHPTVSSLLSVPVASASRVYGWLSLRNKLGTDEFTDVDERVALMLGTHAGVAYETAHVRDELLRRATTLEQELYRTSIRVRDQERARLSRTLHDRVGQTLAGLKFDVHWLAVQLRRVIGPASNDLTGRVDTILQRLDETIESVRTTASELRPAILDTLGLAAAIEWQAGEFERRFGIRCRVDSRIDEITLEPTRATAVFWIVQEALMNVLQHARATRATVTVRRSVKSLTVLIGDNGRGISGRDLAKDGSLGLMGMRERAALLGGRLEVRRRRPAGTVVRLRVPLTGARVPNG